MTIGFLRKNEFGKLHNGFTLVELLVVVAIIAMLLAILLPGLRLARAVSKKTICQSNLKQLAYAWKMYLDYYDGYFYQKSNANANYGGWRGKIQGIKESDWVPRPLNRWVGLPETLYDEKTAEVFCCPADKGGMLDPDNYRERVYRYLGTSYQTNNFLIGPDKFAKTNNLYIEINKRIRCLRITQVTSPPAHLALMGDEGWWFQFKLGSLPDWEQLYKPYAEWHIKPEHYNLAFLDGHIAFVKIRTGYYVTDDYSVIPFEDLYGLARQVQGEVP